MTMLAIKFVVQGEKRLTDLPSVSRPKGTEVTQNTTQGHTAQLLEEEDSQRHADSHVLRHRWGKRLRDTCVGP